MRLKDFTTYALSLMSAMLLFDAVKGVIATYSDKQRLWLAWVTALGMLTISMGVLTLITWADPNDEELP